MENNLIELARSYFTEHSYSTLASQENISQEQAKRGIDAVIPSLFLGLQRKSGHGLGSLLDTLKSSFSGFDFSDVLRFSPPVQDVPQQGDTTRTVLSSLFGNSFDQVIPNTANFLGLNTNSLIRLFSAGIPAVIGALTSNGTRWDTTSIEADLNNNRTNFLKALPVGLPLNILGDEPRGPVLAEDEVITRETIVDPARDVLVEDPIIPATANVRREDPPAALPPADEERRKGAGLWWILIPIILLLLWFFFGKGCNREEPPVTDAHVDSLITDSVVNEDTVPTTEIVRESIMVTLPNDTVINAYKGGIEDQLVQFLNSDYKNLSDEELKDRWFDFDNLNFATGTANILPESQVQLDNLVAILNAFPDAKVKVGGYTDKTGDEAINKKLSNDRAIAVKNAFDAQGVGNRVMATEGYGSQFAEFPADAPESDRVKDRRVAISVRK
ncbi:OmpA family protein [Sphingobacterium sp. 1.A.5]|uniref:OmpA family protein n=1 Tax=Sphingobacterium sp. 1.A.5 TaxID=2044604 RepID=UPI000C0BBBB1|nr:OmpA family protein [Sphingobacterium sp. 1.A.5]